MIKITCEEGGDGVGTGSNGYRPRDSEDESCFCHIEYDCFKYERLIGYALKYAPVSAYMRDTLHWLPAPQRFYYRIAIHLFGVASLALHRPTWGNFAARFLPWGS